jgi:ABC-type multidrug transport system fused ATPase/permease subunit
VNAISFFDPGVINECRSHDQLMALNGLLAELARRQIA